MKRRINIKDLRSTVGTKIYEKTGDIRAAQQQLGHKTLDLTVKRYVHPSREKHMKRVNIIDEYFH